MEEELELELEELELEELELEELELLLLLAAWAGGDNASAASARLAGKILRADVMTLPQEPMQVTTEKTAKAALFFAQFLKLPVSYRPKPWNLAGLFAAPAARRGLAPQCKRARPRTLRTDDS